MASDPCNSETLLFSITHGGVAYGLPIAVSYELSVQDVVIRGEGMIGPSCRSIIGADLTCVCSFLVKPPQASDTGPASLVITTFLGDGGTRTHTLASMVTRGFAYEFNRESPPAMYRQAFAHVGNMQSPSGGTGDLTNVSIA